ncbi:hypothetical protein [Pseudodesulfovibrio sp.]|uniref:hypothetical protein n=1 Tax=unclassified Pseudodesulfovibrio TaxID=2661612 RepID=UPI003B00571E
MPIACIIVTPRAEALEAFTKGLAATGELTVEVMDNEDAALAKVKGAKPGLVIVDEDLPGHKPLALVKAVVMTNAMFNTAVITATDPDTFEDESEGYGVLRPIPFEPSEEDGRSLCEKAVDVIGKQ